MRLVLYEPDIPQNSGTILRLAACLGVAVDVIGPCGFAWDDRRFRRAGLDYLLQAEVAHHSSWRAYRESATAAPAASRLLLLTTRGDCPYTSFRYRADDNLLLGRETVGVPGEVHAAADARLVIPLRPGLRSLNVALAAAMVLGEALRQLDAFPRGDQKERNA